MPELLVSRTFWLTALNLALAALVLAPLLLLLVAVAHELVARVRRRRRDVQWTLVPGIGRIPVLKEDGRGRRRRITRASGPAPEPRTS